MKHLRYFLMSGIVFFYLIGIAHYSHQNSSEDTVFASDASVSFNSLSNSEQILEYEKLVERMLYYPIEESVKYVYGEKMRTAWDYNILDIKRGYYPDTYLYRVTIQFETFTGAHNPPFDLNTAIYDIISFYPLEIKEVSYEHHLSEE